MTTTTYQRVASWMAIVAMLVAALLPSVSMAFTPQPTKGFLQEVCSSSGAKLVILVTTTQGKLIATDLTIESDKKPANLSQHLNHCPYCHFAVDHVALPFVNPAYAIFQLDQAKQALTVYQPPFTSAFPQVAHSSRAPPLYS